MPKKPLNRDYERKINGLLWGVPYGLHQKKGGRRLDLNKRGLKPPMISRKNTVI